MDYYSNNIHYFNNSNLFFSINTLENQRVNFENNKCNPLFMPFASTINKEYKNDPLYNKKILKNV